MLSLSSETVAAETGSMVTGPWTVIAPARMFAEVPGLWLPIAPATVIEAGW